MNLRGIGVSPGIAVGPAVVVQHVEVEIPFVEQTESDVEAAFHEVASALEAVAVSMDVRAEQVTSADLREVLRTTGAIARDPALLDEIRREIESGHGRFHALAIAVDRFSTRLMHLGGYMAERVLDLRDVHRRTHAHLLGIAEPGIPEIHEPSVILSADLAPSTMAALDRSKLLGIVTEQGGPTSHTAILANQWGIPAVLQCEGLLRRDPSIIALDGQTGQVLIDPSDEALAVQRARHERRAVMQASQQGVGMTKDGQHIELLANVSGLEDAIAAAQTDVEGVGLFRTEFMYLNRTEAPSYEEQLEAYTQVFEAFRGRKMVVRTLDAGADKPLDFLPLGDAQNPALGMRGFRLHRHLPTVFRDQLRAIAAAKKATDCEVWVMAPMIATLREAADFSEQARSHGLNTVGVMAEVPSAALRADFLLRGADFMSIGTNDLSQYLFAADRLEGRLASLLDGWQPALWQLTAHAAEASVRRAKPVGMCGEASGDPLQALLAVGAGITSLSMAPAKVPMVRASLALHTVDQCKEMLQAVIDAPDPRSAREAVAGLADPSIVSLT